MSKDILGSLLRVLVTVPDCRLGLIKDLAHKMCGIDGVGQAEELRKFLRKQPCWNDEAPNNLLEYIGSLTIPATTTRFIAKENFVNNTKHNGRVLMKISDTFLTWFLSGSSKTEEPTTEQKLSHHKLQRPSMDGPIITELGGEAKARTTLSEMFFLMQRQRYGENGVLLKNGNANLFHIEDKTNVLRNVHLDWCGGYWFVGAAAYESPYIHDTGDQVFSRNLVE